MKVQLNNVTNAALFVATCNEFIDNIDYQCGRYVIDAKSILGVLSIDLRQLCDVIIYTTDEDVQKMFYDKISLWEDSDEQ